MQIKWADFKGSFTSVWHCPDSATGEIAFIGRSNVGKSSLINYLVERKSLVKVSRTPGKTQLLNFFLINNHFFFVDLPGYGYAKVPKGVRIEFSKMIEDYIRHRESLRCVCLLVDCRIEPQESDIQVARNLAQWNSPFIIIYTKSEKISRHQIGNHKAEFLKASEIPHETRIFITSASHKIGKEELLSYFENILKKDTANAH